jgi:hypothetical protein
VEAEKSRGEKTAGALLFIYGRAGFPGQNVCIINERAHPLKNFAASVPLASYGSRQACETKGMLNFMSFPASAIYKIKGPFSQSQPAPNHFCIIQ